MSEELTYYPVGAYMVMFYDATHNRVKIHKWDKGLVAAEDFAKQQVSCIPHFHSYVIAHVVKNSLIDKWNPKSHE